MEEKELRTGTEEGKDSGAEEKDGQEYEKILLHLPPAGE